MDSEDGIQYLVTIEQVDNLEDGLRLLAKLIVQAHFNQKERNAGAKHNRPDLCISIPEHWEDTEPKVWHKVMVPKIRLMKLLENGEDI